jgi:hypothetical protein
VNERDYYENIVVGGRIVLKWGIKKEGVRIWTIHLFRNTNIWRLANEWLQEKNYAAGRSGEGGISDTGDNCKYLRKLSGKKEKDC